MIEERARRRNNHYKCFVIMPFSESSPTRTKEYWTIHFEQFLKLEIQKVPNVDVQRSEELRADIIREIIKDLYRSDIVVADLTDLNPNVFWELGVRQTLKSGTITIAEVGTELPFDVSTKSTLFYYPGDDEMNKAFLNDLRKAVQDCIDDPSKIDSTVIDTIQNLPSLSQNATEDEIKVLLGNKIDDFNQKMQKQGIESEVGMCISIHPVQTIEIKTEEYNGLIEFLEKNGRYGPEIASASRILMFNELKTNRRGIWSFNNNSLIGNIQIENKGDILFYMNYSRTSPIQKLRIPHFYMTAFMLGLLDLAERLYSHLQYENLIDVGIRLFKVKGWTYSPMAEMIPFPDKYKFPNQDLDLIFKTYVYETLKENNKKLQFVKEIMNEILLETGFLEGYQIHPELDKQYKE